MSHHKEKHDKDKNKNPKKSHSNQPSEEDPQGTSLWEKVTPSELLEAPSDFTHIYHEPSPLSCVITDEKPKSSKSSDTFSNGSFDSDRDDKEKDKASDVSSNQSPLSRKIEKVPSPIDTSSDQSPPKTVDKGSDSSSNGTCQTKEADKYSDSSSSQSSDSPPPKSPPLKLDTSKKSIRTLSPPKGHVQKTDKVLVTKRLVNGVRVVVKKVRVTTERVFDENNKLVSEKVCEPIVLVDHTAEFAAKQHAKTPQVTKKPQVAEKPPVVTKQQVVETVQVVKKSPVVEKPPDAPKHQVVETAQVVKKTTVEKPPDATKQQVVETKQVVKKATIVEKPPVPAKSMPVILEKSDNLEEKMSYQMKSSGASEPEIIETRTETIHHEKKVYHKKQLPPRVSSPSLPAIETQHTNHQPQGTFDAIQYLKAVGSGKVTYTDPWTGERINHKDRAPHHRGHKKK